jgi:hypothetical protein
VIAGIITPEGAFTRTRLALEAAPGLGVRLFRYRGGNGLYLFDGNEAHRVAETAIFKSDSEIAEVHDQT